jgi:predicted DNA-binding transcriptional regulator AlpA
MVNQVNQLDLSGVWLKKPQVCERYQVSPTTLWRAIRDGKFPDGIPVRGHKRWAEKQLERHDKINGIPKG